jgi:segregation and condensation protein B
MQGLECLAIIAYKQPITKAEIEAIRGVVSDGAMKTLLERRMVTIVGRSEKAGRPLLYGTTPEFLHYFGIKQLSDLPRIEEFEALAKEKMEELSEQELEMINALDDSDAEQTPRGDDQENTDSQVAQSAISAENAPEEGQTDEAAPQRDSGEHMSARSPVNAADEQASERQNDEDAPRDDSAERQPRGDEESGEIDSDQSAGAEQDSHEKS